MHSYSEALAALTHSVPVPDWKHVPITEAAGRVLAAPAYSPQALPNSRRSAVDGYALADRHSTSWRIMGTYGAGEGSPELQEGQAVAVMTGAGVPDSAVTVVRWEDTQVQDNELQLTTKVPAQGQSINETGSEAPAGQQLLAPGVRLNPLAYSILCYAGVSQVAIYQPLKTGLLLSGNELLPPGAIPQPGYSYDSNSYLLHGILQQLGAQVSRCGPVGDDPQQLQYQLQQLIDSCDLVVTCAGAARGQYDYIRQLLQARSDFVSLVDYSRIKPGRPLLAGNCGNTLVCALPGYPAACLTNLFIYLIPVIKKASGWRHWQPQWQQRPLRAPARGRTGRTDLVRVRQEVNTEAAAGLWPLPDQLTSHYLGFANCEGLLLLDEATAELAAGSQGAFLHFQQELGP